MVKIRQEFYYEFDKYPPAGKAFKCLCDRLNLESQEETMGGGLSASTNDRSLHARMTTTPQPRGGLKVEVLIHFTTEEELSAVTACFGQPQRQRKIAPSALEFAKIVQSTEFTGDTEDFVGIVAHQLGIEPNRFGSYRAMILTSSRMRGASDTIKKAAKKLKKM